MITETGKILKYYRCLNGSTMQALSDSLKSTNRYLARTTISQIENGKQNPSKTAIRKLAGAFGMTYLDLLKALKEGVSEEDFNLVCETIK